MIGYCYEIAHKDVEYQGKLVWSQVIDRALCFEYMKGGSLAKHISAESCIHNWPITYKIIKGTCEGLHHLHKGGEKKIFHLDLKPDNVLLDEELVPKIGDFGLSELFGSSYTHQQSSTKGTIGFMPQEYIHNRKVSPKNDVFSLGVIIFHIMAGEKGYSDYWDARRRPNFSPKIQHKFIESVQEYWKKKMETMEGYRWDETDLLGVTRCIDMAMRCVEDDRDKRPYIKDIINELNKLDSEVSEMLKKDPKPPIGQLKRKNRVNDLEAVKQNKSFKYLGKDIVVDPSQELCFPFESNKNTLVENRALVQAGS
uniref:Protein kinase domain-containing protein n=3 Tax=Triticum urartu TaxID=4572 RepID=A0A8R7UAP5_TRIUA